MKKLEEFAKKLGYPNVENLEANIENYGEPLLKWWDVIKSITKEDSQNDIDLSKEQLIKKSIECYEFIDKAGEKLSKECLELIEPLLDRNKFKEAKKETKEFFREATVEDNIIFIEYNLIFAHINRRASKFKKIRNE